MILFTDVAWFSNKVHYFYRCSFGEELNSNGPKQTWRMLLAWMKCYELPCCEVPKMENLHYISARPSGFFFFPPALPILNML